MRDFYKMKNECFSVIFIERTIIIINMPLHVCIQFPYSAFIYLIIRQLIKLLLLSLSLSLAHNARKSKKK